MVAIIFGAVLVALGLAVAIGAPWLGVHLEIRHREERKQALHNEVLVAASATSCQCADAPVSELAYA